MLAGVVATIATRAPVGFLTVTCVLVGFLAATHCYPSATRGCPCHDSRDRKYPRCYLQRIFRGYDGLHDMRSLQWNRGTSVILLHLSAGGDKFRPFHLVRNEILNHDLYYASHFQSS